MRATEVERQRKMTQDYESRNLHGFESDEIAAQRVKKLLQDFNVDLAVELGTYLGGTARRLAMMCQTVVTIEINIDHYARAAKTLEPCHNVALLFGSTVDVLPILLRGLIHKSLLFWVDSHWEANNPLLQELAIIAEHKIKPVLCIHDFKVLGHPELGFDTYKDIVYEWSWIKPSIEMIYGVDGYEIEYNSLAEGAKRGIVYITPKRTGKDHELTFDKLIV